MKYQDFRFNGTHLLSFDAQDTAADEKAICMKDEFLERAQENMEYLSSLQKRLYAEKRASLIISFHGMECSGKDTSLRFAAQALDCQSVCVRSFSSPTSQDLSHDFLWRFCQNLPAKGNIAFFDSSYYEDIVRTAVIRKNSSVSGQIRQIRDFEKYLFENNILMIKVFLHLSKSEQKKRLLRRMNLEETDWNIFSDAAASRALWNKYHAVYERLIRTTAAKYCPWYVIPADDPWFVSYLMSEILVDALNRLHPAFPEKTPEQIQRLFECRRLLMRENG